MGLHVRGGSEKRVIGADYAVVVVVVEGYHYIHFFFPFLFLHKKISFLKETDFVPHINKKEPLRLYKDTKH